MRAILIDPETQSLTEVELKTGDSHEINKTIGVSCHAIGAYLGGSREEGFDAIAVNDDDMEEWDLYLHAFSPSSSARFMRGSWPRFCGPFFHEWEYGQPNRACRAAMSAGRRMGAMAHLGMGHPMGAPMTIPRGAPGAFDPLIGNGAMRNSAKTLHSSCAHGVVAGLATIRIF
jgi:hypothetical protein